MTKDFDAVAFKHKVQEKIYEEIKDLSTEEIVEYFNKGGERVWRKIEALREKSKKSQRVKGKTGPNAAKPVRAVARKKKFDAVAMKHKIQAKTYEEIKNLTPEEEIEYFNKGGERVLLEIEALRGKKKRARRTNNAAAKTKSTKPARS